MMQHGHTTVHWKSPTYCAWDAMRQRCNNPKHPSYHHYGGRGILVTTRWASFRNFLIDMGTCPEGLTLDRIDNDGNYNKRNCRWATQAEQMRNLRKNRNFTIGNETQCLRVWARRYNVPFTTLHRRLSVGWPIEEALTLAPFTRRT